MYGFIFVCAVTSLQINVVRADVLVSPINLCLLGTDGCSLEGPFAGVSTDKIHFQGSPTNLILSASLDNGSASTNPFGVVLLKGTIPPQARGLWHFHNAPIMIQIVQGTTKAYFVRPNGTCRVENHAAGDVFFEQQGVIDAYVNLSLTDNLVAYILAFVPAGQTNPVTIVEGTSKQPTDASCIPTLAH